MEVTLAPGGASRLDKALHEALSDQAPELSRARLQALMAEGAVTRDGQAVMAGSARAAPGLYLIEIPAPAPAEPQAQDIPLTILFEDAHLIVLDKPAGMAVHPGPGRTDGTLVNALLHHCAGSLSGVGGVARPGIVHRLDADTSGVMVAAKTDQAHQALSKLFAAHDIERAYIALVRGAPRPERGRVETRIGRSQHDRKKMAVLTNGGRVAITDYALEGVWGPQERPLAARVRCTLQTGRTHQIRVHMASLGCPVLGDPVYGSGAPAGAVREAMAEAGLGRQALHATVLGFVHPVTGERLRFESALPADMAALQQALTKKIA
ncbi:RluA family pseudouridine synthase [Brevundimonas sp. 2R-24]|uniref:Pseudouridine synthase n=1 Tax=Peiella sedimenti TaxID=3061083 RepID=A0ABT8SQE3_9CAUL|nr:RluA family pseudouridine synthase [Caulobacteraceae bacterium XZ-24]